MLTIWENKSKPKTGKLFDTLQNSEIFIKICSVLNLVCGAHKVKEKME